MRTFSKQNNLYLVISLFLVVQLFPRKKKWKKQKNNWNEQIEQ